MYVVATPLGNLEDVTLRALRVLRDASLIACEDTRRTAKLLRAHGILTRTTSYFEHNERWKGEQILAELRLGHDVALVSDAGTPGISDPGFRLVREARAAGLCVLPVPGASAAVAALSVAGLPTDRFLFVGFLPAKASARQKAIAEFTSARETLVFYESPVRILATLADLQAAFGDREAFLGRELTKLHEEHLRGRLSTLRAGLSSRQTVKGEIVLVLAGASKASGPQESAEALFSRLVEGGKTRREAVKEVARALGLPAREVYARVLSLTGKSHS